MNLFRTSVLGVTALCASGTLLVSTAQESAPTDSEKKFETIIVSAQRRDEAITDVPLAITAKTGDDLIDAGVVTTSDLAGVVPNLQVNSSFGKTQPNFSLRGVSVANEYNANQASPIGVYVDDAYMASRSSHGMQIYDLERVEVLRGPQGTLYGRNTTGGAINFLTVFPDLNGNEGDIKAGIGTYNLREASGAFEATLAEDVFGARFAFNYLESDGVIDNLTPGAEDPNSADSIGGRLSLRAKPSDKLDIKFKVYAGQDDGTQAGVHGIGVDPNGVNPLNGYTRSGLDFFEVEQERIGKNSTDASGAFLRVDYDLSDAWTLSYIGSYDEGTQDVFQDSDGSATDLLSIDWGSDFEQINQELRFAYAGDTLNLQTGVYYGEDEVKSDNTFNFFLVAGTCDPATLAACTIRQRYTQTRDSWAVFAQSDWEFTPNWTLTTGLRYTEDSNEYSNGNAYIGDENRNFIVTTIPGGAAGQNDVLPARSESESAVTGRIALSWDYGDDDLIYASYSHGYRAGAFNGSGYLAPAQIVYVDPETVDAFEIGAKGVTFGGTTRYSASIFHYDYKDQQVQEVVGPVAFLRNGDKATIDGIEIEAEFLVSDNFTVDASIGLLDTEYEGLTLSGTALSGNRLPFAPETTAQLGFDWEAFQLGEGQVRFNGNASYASQVWYSPFNGLNGNTNLQQGDNTKVNLSATYDHGSWSARVWGRNVFEEETITYGLDLRAAFGYDYLLPGEPATFGVSLGYEF